MLSLLQLLGDDLVQILAVCGTARFAGIQNNLYILPVSILSLSVNLGRLLQGFVFGKKVQRGAKLGLQLLYITMTAVWVSVAVTLTLNDTFCELSRSASSPQILVQLGECPAIGGFVSIQGNEGGVSQAFVAQRLAGAWTVVNNTGRVDLAFTHLEVVTSDMVVSGNSGGLSLWFAVLETLPANVTLAVSANGLGLNLSLPLLFDIDQGGSLSITGNLDRRSLSLPAMTRVRGTLAIRRNSFSSLDLALVQHVDGRLSVEDEQATTLSLTSLYTVSGAVNISGTTQLRNVAFPSLTQVGGVLAIEHNEVLESLSFPQATEEVFNLVISGNARLVQIRLERMFLGVGVILVENNPRLTELSLPRLSSLDYLGVLSNTALGSMDFSRLDCNYAFNVVLLGNTNLGNVTIPSRSCLHGFFDEGGNHKLRFVCLDGSC